MAFLRTRLSFVMLAILLTACSAAGGQVQPSQAPATGVPSANASPAPTASQPAPMPTRTPPPAPRAFTEPFSAELSYWSYRDVDSGQPAAGPGMRDGFLVFDLAATDQWAYAIYDPQQYGDVLIETQVQSRSAGDGAAGLICRYGEKQGWYEFNIFADKTYELLFGQWLEPGVARYVPLYHGESDKIQADSNEISLACEGNLLMPTINGVPMRKWQELKFGLQTGQVGLSASSFQDAPFTIAFDWVRVSLP